jgi:hypothetical protein
MHIVDFYYKKKKIFYLKLKEGMLTGLISYPGSCLLKRVIEGKIEGRIEVRERRGRRRKQVLDGFKKTRGY